MIQIDPGVWMLTVGGKGATHLSDSGERLL